MANVAGIVLAAGAGSRMGQPKALVTGRTGRPWVVDAVTGLRAAGCQSLHVAVGAAADQVRMHLDPDVQVIEVADWQAGMSASLRSVLRALEQTPAESALIHLVDLPDVGADVVARIMSHGSLKVLARASYDGRPGHPVVIGREHWAGVIESLTGDSGAATYLTRHGVAMVECGDLATGLDVDTQAELLEADRIRAD